MVRENRFRVAMTVYVVLGVLDWLTLSSDTVKVITSPNGQPLFDLSIRGIALAALGLFAFRTWIHRHREALEEKIDNERSRE